jgi:hypothetical protein
MKKITVKKSYKGYVSVKSTLIDECIKEKESLVIIYNKKKMTISPDKLNKHIQLSKQIFRSSDGSNYKLYDYFFKEDKKNENI